MIILDNLIKMKNNGDDVNMYLATLNGEESTCEYGDLGIADDSDAEEIFNLLDINYLKDIKYPVEEYPLVEYGEVLRSYANFVKEGVVYSIDFNLVRDNCCADLNRGFWDFDSIRVIPDEPTIQK